MEGQLAGPNDQWRPHAIEVEPTFDRFIRTFRNGVRVCDVLPVAEQMPMNADYFFPDDKVIAELKSLETDGGDPAGYAKRVAESFRHFGYTGSDFFGWMYRGEAMPAEVSRNVFSKMRRSVREASKKANKQIRSTKALLHCPDARGLLLVANDNNYGLSPQLLVGTIAETLLKLEDSHVDGFVYFTPNVYHEVEEYAARGIAVELWIPVYKPGSESMSDFVNALGSAWGDFNEANGDPYLMRGEVNSDQEGEYLIAKSKPIERFKKKSTG
jgi:hypothetical protein